MNRQKRVAAIHDISGFGRCSLTVALPIISAAGIETCALPTAVLSTHTGGIQGYTYRDLTDDMPAFAKHWKSLNIKFDALYSGFLGSFKQIDIVEEIFSMFKANDNFILVDPVMADNGKLYAIYTPEMAQGMAKLCAKADIIIPNMTEASLMLNEEYNPGPYTKEYVEHILTSLAKMGPKQVIVTGVILEDPDKIGAACYDKTTNVTDYQLGKRIDGYYHGTGDVFGSVITACLLNGLTLSQATRTAVDFTRESIERTVAAKTDIRFGVDFESGLCKLAQQLNK